MTAVPRLVQERASSTILGSSQDMNCSSDELLLHTCTGAQHMGDRCVILGSVAMPPTGWGPFRDQTSTRYQKTLGSAVAIALAPNLLRERCPQALMPTLLMSNQCQQSWCPAAAPIWHHAVVLAVSTRQLEPSLVLQRL